MQPNQPFQPPTPQTGGPQPMGPAPQSPGSPQSIQQPMVAAPAQSQPQQPVFQQPQQPVFQPAQQPVAAAPQPQAGNTMPPIPGPMQSNQPPVLAPLQPAALGQPVVPPASQYPMGQTPGMSQANFGQPTQPIQGSAPGPQSNTFGQSPTPGIPGGIGMTGRPPQKKSPLSFIVSKLKFIIPALVLIVILGVGVFFAKGILFDSTKIKSSSLVEKTDSGISLKMPSEWKESSEKIAEFDKVYTKDGKGIENKGNMFIGYTSEYTGYDFNILTTDERAQIESIAPGMIKSSLEAASSDSSDSVCSKFENVTVEEAYQANFDMSFESNMTCKKSVDSKDRVVNIRILVGYKGTSMYSLVAGAYEDIWNKNKTVIDEIYSSFAPDSTSNTPSYN